MSSSRSDEVAISARGLGKAYQVYAKPQDRLKQMLLGSSTRRFYNEFWAVRGVDLEIYRGETVGIIGRNGSGKSTLLQMICGTLEPTEGDLSVKGRVAALLELGAGFNGEFTGYDNIFLNAAILGMEAEFVEQRLDKIIAFADIGPHLHQPVKTYSSGMFARLAFAVAIHVDPQILVVDEALSVGDEAFQRKCFARIHQIREAGATILFVSHSGATIIELCNRAVLLDAGRRLMTGIPKTVIGKYQKLAYAPADKAEAIRQEILFADALGGGQEAEVGSGESGVAELPMEQVADNSPHDEQSKAWFDPHLLPKSTMEYASRGAELKDVRILDAAGQRVNVLLSGEAYRYSFKVEFREPAFSVRAGMLIKTLSGLELGGLATSSAEKAIDYVEAGTVMEVELPFVCRLTAGTYFLNAGVMARIDGEFTFLHRVLDVAMFRVQYRLNTVVTGLVDFSGAEPMRVRRLVNT